MLPVVGIGMLMRYMPVKKFLPFLLCGFVLSAYLQVPVLGIAIAGFAAAFWYFTTEINKAEAPAAVSAAVTAEDEMGDDFDE
ncbi:MAG: PTS sugar transporter subunit IIC [Lachnospiraceae bacterium]|nr:PTS sugar transporter subunit IIC [Lachnospiraceae bacterium]